MFEKLFNRPPRSEKEIEECAKKQEEKKLVSFIKSEHERRKRERLPYELKWTLCANFFMGNQYCDINPYRDMGIEQFVPENKSLEREVFNRIAPIIETRIANLQKVTYAMIVKPRRDDIDDMAKADVSTKILRHWQDVTHFDARKNKAIVWNEITGNAFWVAGWNKNAGRVTAKGLKSYADDKGNVCEKIVEFHEGDVEYSLLSSYEVYPEDCLKEGIESQPSILVEQVMTANEAYNRYGYKCDGESVQTFVITPKPISFGMEKECTGNTLSTATKENSVRIFTYYERPGREYPKGREIVMADFDGGKILHNGELSYGTIPIEQIKCKSVPGQFFGKSIIEELIPLQRAYNDVKNRIHEHIKRIALGTLLVEEDSLETDIEQYGLPAGGVVKYKHGFNKPQNMPAENLPGEVLKEAETLGKDMEYVAGVSQLQMIGSAPSGITSGTAIESLREIDNTRMAMTSEYIREAVLKLGVLVLKIYKQFGKLPRIVNYTGLNGIGNALVWTGEDIQSFEVDFETENELVLSEEMQLQRFNQAVEFGYYTDENGVIPQRVKNMGLEKLKLGRYSELLGMNTLSIQQAQRETTYMRSGMFCDINSYDDDEIHAEEHKRFILSTEYEMLKAKKPQWAELILSHYEAHVTRLAEKKAAQPPMAM